MRHRASAGLALLLLALPPAVPALRQAVAAQSSSYEQLQTFSGVLSQIRLYYVDSVTTGDLVRAAIDGMLRSLDPHSYFQTRSEVEKVMAWELGRLAGAGLILEDVEGRPTVLAVYPTSPAEKAGVLAGDRLLSMNDTSVAGVAAKTLQARLLGEKGHKVRLVLERGPRLEPDSLRVSLKYDLLKPQPVADVRMLDGTTGYVRFQEFSLKSGEELRDAFSKLLKKEKARQIILDLRANPGGDMRAAVETASQFLPKGAIVFREQGRRRNATQEIRTQEDGEFATVPLIVLVDERTASAAEALAGSLQDHDRALILGRRSFGKALIQRLLPVPPAGDAVWLTVAYIVTPSGRVIQRRYRGLNVEQYYSFGGRSGAGQDTLQVFHTDHGREVRGGGGIVPDVSLPAPSAAPVWLSVATDSSFDFAVADSVAQTIAADANGRAAWLADTAQWKAKLLTSFLDRVRSRLRVNAPTGSTLESQIARRLAARVAEVRWGADARDELLVRSDSDISAALGYFPQLPELLKAK